MASTLTSPMTNLPPAATLPAATAEQAAKIKKVATDFEQSFLQVMLGQMFDTVSTSSFGGGEGEQAFKSFLTEAFSKQMTAGGGVGLSKQLTHELLKMQGLSPGAPA